MTAEPPETYQARHHRLAKSRAVPVHVQRNLTDKQYTSIEDRPIRLRRFVEV